MKRIIFSSVCAVALLGVNANAAEWYDSVFANDGTSNADTTKLDNKDVDNGLKQLGWTIGKDTTTKHNSTGSGIDTMLTALAAKGTSALNDKAVFGGIAKLDLKYEIKTKTINSGSDATAVNCLKDAIEINKALDNVKLAAELQTLLKDKVTEKVATSSTELAINLTETEVKEVKKILINNEVSGIQDSTSDDEVKKKLASLYDTTAGTLKAYNAKADFTAASTDKTKLEKALEDINTDLGKFEDAKTELANLREAYALYLKYEEMSKTKALVESKAEKILAEMEKAAKGSDEKLYDKFKDIDGYKAIYLTKTVDSTNQNSIKLVSSYAAMKDNITSIAIEKGIKKDGASVKPTKDSIENPTSENQNTLTLGDLNTYIQKQSDKAEEKAAVAKALANVNEGKFILDGVDPTKLNDAMELFKTSDSKDLLKVDMIAYIAAATYYKTELKEADVNAALAKAKEKEADFLAAQAELTKQIQAFMGEASITGQTNKKEINKNLGALLNDAGFSATILSAALVSNDVTLDGIKKLKEDANKEGAKQEDKDKLAKIQSAANLVASTVAEGKKESTSNQALSSLNVQINNMNKRLGEIRGLNGEIGTWLRVYGGRYSSDNNHFNYYSTQIGADKLTSLGNGDLIIGALFGFDKVNADAKTKTASFGAYTSYIDNSGLFLDAVAKYAHSSHKQDSFDIKNQNLFLLSLEGGYRFSINDASYIEPSLELITGYVGKYEAKTSKASITVDSFTPLVFKPQVFFGYSIDDFTLRAGVGAVLNAKSPNYSVQIKEIIPNLDANSAKIRLDKNNYGFASIGGSYKFADNLRLNLGVERSFGGKLTQDYEVNAVLRYTF